MVKKILATAPPSFCIRPAQPCDLAAIVAIYNESVAGKQATADLTPVTITDRQAWFYQHTDKRPLYVACDDHDASSLLGWGSLSDLYARPAYHIGSEISVYVSERAKGQGVGRALVQRLLHDAPRCGIHQVVALVFAHNTPSLTLFRKLGFAEWGTYPQICDMDGFIADVAILGKTVATPSQYASQQASPQGAK